MHLELAPGDLQVVAAKPSRLGSVHSQCLELCRVKLVEAAEVVKTSDALCLFPNEIEAMAQ
jgi:hypothetical protein